MNGRAYGTLSQTHTHSQPQQKLYPGRTRIMCQMAYAPLLHLSLSFFLGSLDVLADANVHHKCIVRYYKGYTEYARYQLHSILFLTSATGEFNAWCSYVTMHRTRFGHITRLLILSTYIYTLSFFFSLQQRKHSD